MTYALLCVLTPFVAAAAGDVLKRRLARVRVPVQCRERNVTTRAGVPVLILSWIENYRESTVVCPLDKHEHGQKDGDMATLRQLNSG
jgi:hypothetical protein